MNSLNLVSLTKIYDALVEIYLRSCMLPVLSCDIDEFCFEGHFLEYYCLCPFVPLNPINTATIGSIMLKMLILLIYLLYDTDLLNFKI